MAAPQIPLYTGELPSRVGQTKQQFSDNINDWVGYQPDQITGTNEISEFVNDKAIEADASAEAAALSAEAATAAANFKGRWSDATGAATLGSTYNHENATWLLLQDIPDITLDEPSNVAVNWQQVTYRELYDVEFDYKKDTRVIDLVDNRPYISTVDNNLGNVPSSDDGTYWIVDIPILDWGKGRDYAIGEQAYSPINRRRYSSQVTPNINNEPSVDDGTNWLTEYGKVETPTMTNPADQDTGINAFPLLQATPYVILGSDNPQEWAVWQIATDSLFTDIVYDSGIVAAGDHRVTSALLSLTVYYARVAYKGVRTDVSDFSPAAEFTTGLALSEFLSITHDTGNGVELSVLTNIDFTVNDGSIFMANRDDNNQGRIFQTKSGLKSGYPYAPTIPTVEAEGLKSYNDDGITVGNIANINGSGDSISTYAIRDRAGFHDTVLYTGNGSTNRDIPHNLGVQAGMVIFKRLETFQSSFSDYWFKHKDLGSTTIKKMANAGYSGSGAGAMTDTDFNVTSTTTNGSGEDMIAEVFAHNPIAGIYCGLYTGNGSTQKIVTGFPVGLFLVVTSGSSRIVDIKKGGEDMIIINSSQAYSFAGTGNSFDVDGMTVGGNLNNNGQAFYFVAIADPEQF